MVLPPLYQRPPEAEIPAMGFAVSLKILVNANLLSSCTRFLGTSDPPLEDQSDRRRRGSLTIPNSGPMEMGWPVPDYIYR
jgi:hypothetical protein